MRASLKCEETATAATGVFGTLQEVRVIVLRLTECSDAKTRKEAEALKRVLDQAQAHAGELQRDAIRAYGTAQQRNVQDISDRLLGGRKHHTATMAVLAEVA